MATASFLPSSHGAHHSIASLSQGDCISKDESLQQCTMSDSIFLYCPTTVNSLMQHAHG
jgi:hypothetical protein